MLFVEMHAQTAASHHAVPIGACASAPDVRQGALGRRRPRLDVLTSCFVPSLLFWCADSVVFCCQPACRFLWLLDFRNRLCKEPSPDNPRCYHGAHLRR